MASESTCYRPTGIKDGCEEYELYGFILPPLRTQTTKAPPKRRQRIWLAAAVAILAVAAIVTAAVIAVSLTKHRVVEGVTDGFNATDRYEAGGNWRNRESHFDFKRDLRRFYDRLMDGNKPGDLKRIFDFYQGESSGMEDVSDLRDFVISLDAEELAPYWKSSRGSGLTEEDVRSAVRLTSERALWYRTLDQLKKNVTAYETQRHADRVTATIPHVEMDRRKTNEVNELLKEWIQPIETLISNSTVVFRRRIILLSQIKEMMDNDESLRGKPNVYVFALSTVHVDVDLMLPGTNLAVVSPEWDIASKRIISLDGRDAEEHRSATAAAGIRGRPGRNGGGGGHFLGIGNIHESRLSLLNRGGRGGSGQNGANGPDGNGTFSDLDYLSWSEGGCKTLLRDDIHRNVYGEVILYYKVYNYKGCGGDGTDGGAPGEGGRGGTAVWMNTKRNKVSIRSGPKGTDGRSGKGGRGGRGARFGCYYYAQGVKEDRLQPVTAPFCATMNMPSGIDGKDNVGDAERGPQVEATAEMFSDAVRQFKAYAIGEYAKGYEEIGGFLSEMDDFPAYRNTSRSSDFLWEFELVRGSGRAELVRSLADRIAGSLKYASDRRESNALRYVLALSHGKLVDLKHRLDRYIVVDLEKYLDGVDRDLGKTGSAYRPYRDHAIPNLVQLFEGKISYLNDSLDRWTRKMSKWMRVLDSDLGEVRGDASLAARKMDSHEMTYLTLTVAKFLKPLCAAMTDPLNVGEVPATHRREMAGVLREYEARLGQGRSRALREMPGADPRMGELLSRFSSLPNNLPDTSGEWLRNCTVARDQFFRRRNEMIQRLKSLAGDGLNPVDAKEDLTNLKKSMRMLNHFIGDVSSAASDFPIDLENMEATVDLIDIIRDKTSFVKSVDEVNAINGSGPVDSAQVQMRNYLSEMWVTMQYKDAERSFRLWVFPHVDAYDRSLPKSDRMTVEEARRGVRLMAEWVREYKSSIMSYDKYIKEAVFSSNNSVGEYYRWDNSEIRDELRELLAGREITLTADVENFHMLTKNAIKFATARIEFQPRSGQPLSDIFNSVQVEMTHSGYSYYYYNRKSYLHIGEELELRYSYERRPSGEPVNYNMVYRKLMEGPAVFSPFTTWRMRLRPVGAARKLLRFAGDVDVALVGSGSYVQVGDDRST